MHYLVMLSEKKRKNQGIAKMVRSSHGRGPRPKMEGSGKKHVFQRECMFLGA